MNLRQPSHRAGQTQGPAPPQLGSITVTRAYLGKLKSLILSEEELKAHAYRVMVYNQAELMNLRRCMLCCRKFSWTFLCFMTDEHLELRKTS